MGRGDWCLWPVPVDSLPTSWVEFRWDGRGWQVSVLRDASRTELRAVRQATSGWSEIRAGTEVKGPEVTLTLLDDAPPAPFAVDLDRGEPVMPPELDQLIWWEAEEARNLDPDAPAEPIRDGERFVSFGRRLRLHNAPPVTRTRRTAIDLLDSSLTLCFGSAAGKYRLDIHSGGTVETLRDRAVLAAIAYALARDDRSVTGGFIDADDAAARMARYEGAAEGTYAPRYLRELRSRLCRCLATAGVNNPSALFEVDPERGRLWRLRAKTVRFEG